jgi:ribonuclease E
VAKDFMKMIMPSHAKNVKYYAEGLPLFARYQVESYLASMFNPTVQLPSGGYIVIGVTEALVAVDVNSGRATKEGSIEQTALKTNLEAADEVARQLRLRDLAGLIVIDFIDMDERKNNAAVEKRMKDRLKTDRARIQVGRISGFGLMEMSRQRLRPGMIEATTQACPACHGTGLIRSDDNLALSILRQIEEEGTRRRSREVLIKAPVGIANFLMNQKREHIAQIETRYGLSVRIEGDPMLVSPDFAMEKFKTATRVVKADAAQVVSVDTSLMDEVDSGEGEDAVKEAPEDTQNEAQNADGDGEGRNKRRRRRRRRGGRNKSGGADGQAQNDNVDTQSADEEAASQDSVDTGSPSGDADQQEPVGASISDEAVSDTPDDKPKRKRSRTRKPKNAQEDGNAPTEEGADTDVSASQNAEEQQEKPKRKRSSRSAKAQDEAVKANASGEEPDNIPEAREDPPAPDVPAAAVETSDTQSIAPAQEAVSASADIATTTDAVPAKPKRKGWWSIGG